MKPIFPHEVCEELLHKLVNPPPSDAMLATFLVERIQTFVAEPPHDAATIWNFYKEVLDLLVRYGAGNDFVLSLFDVEPFYAPPLGSYNQADGSITNAPWRVESASVSG